MWRGGRCWRESTLLTLMHTSGGDAGDERAKQDGMMNLACGVKDI